MWYTYNMKRPDNKIMLELDKILQEIDEHENVLSNLNEKLNNFPKYVSDNISSFDEKLEIAKYLYWTFNNIKLTSMSESLLNVKPHECHKLVYTTDNNFVCAVCKNFIILKSRTHKNELIRDKNHDGELICVDCRKIKNKDYWEAKNLEDQKRREKIQENINYLKSLPYKEYLQTEHWKDLRKRMMNRANYSCGMCNSKNVILHVHHKSYKNLGDEDYSDLIVLCEDCHYKFHDKLPN